VTVVVARESIVAPGHRAIPKGSIVDASDEAVKANPDLFESPEQAAGYAEEAAKPAKKAAAKP
jgi:hypothetical protein